MKNLFKLVLSTINNSNNPKIFWVQRESEVERIHGNLLEVLSSNAAVSLDMEYPMYTTPEGYIETDYYFSFVFKYEDGDPNVSVRLNNLAPSKVKWESIPKYTKLKTLLYKQVYTEERHVICTYPTYKIVMGELSYITTIDESKELHDAYLKLGLRHEDANIKKLEQQVEDRLQGKVKLK